MIIEISLIYIIYDSYKQGLQINIWILEFESNRNINKESHKYKLTKIRNFENKEYKL